MNTVSLHLSREGNSEFIFVDVRFRITHSEDIEIESVTVTEDPNENLSTGEEIELTDEEIDANADKFFQAHVEQDEADAVDFAIDSLRDKWED